MIIHDFKTNPFAKAAIVKAQALRARRNTKLATIAVNVLGGLIGAFCVVYAIDVLLG